MQIRCIAWKSKPRDGFHIFSCADAQTKTVCENVQTTVRKREIRFAAFVARVGNERLVKPVVFGELEGGKRYLRGQEQDWMGCLERYLSLFLLNNRPIEEKQWTLAANKSG